MTKPTDNTEVLFTQAPVIRVEVQKGIVEACQAAPDTTVTTVKKSEADTCTEGPLLSVGNKVTHNFAQPFNDSKTWESITESLKRMVATAQDWTQEHYDMFETIKAAVETRNKRFRSTNGNQLTGRKGTSSIKRLQVSSVGTNRYIKSTRIGVIDTHHDTLIDDPMNRVPDNGPDVPVRSSDLLEAHQRSANLGVALNIIDAIKPNHVLVHRAHTAVMRFDWARELFVVTDIYIGVELYAHSDPHYAQEYLDSWVTVVQEYQP